MNEVVMKVIGNYTYNTRDCLGEGVFGKVFVGYDRDTHQKVAIKKVQITSYSHDKYLQTSIFYEIFLLKNLKHPNIVSFKDVLTTKNSLYIITQFCKNGDLKQALKRKRYRQDEALDVIKQIISGFSQLVKEHIVHRDLKPANILINDGIYKIGDFGFAKYVQNMDNHMLKTYVGSPIYMSPQLLEHTYYTTKADVWSIGIISFEILFGTPPWKARNQTELLQNIRNISLNSIIRNQPTKVSQGSLDFLKRCLTYYEKDRMTWEEMFAFFKIQQPQQIVFHQQQLNKNKQLPIVSSVNVVTNRKSNVNEIQKYRSNNIHQESQHLKPVQPHSSMIQSPNQYSSKQIPLAHKSSLLGPEQLKRIREQCIFKHFIAVQLQANYTIIEAILGETKKFDRMLLLLTGSSKLKSTYALSGIQIRKQSLGSNGQQFYKVLQKQKQSYEMAEKQITKLLQKQGTLKPLKQQVASKLSSVQGGQGRIIKAQQLLLQSSSQISKIIYHELKRKIHTLIDSFTIVRILDYILDVINLSIFKNKDYSISELLITPTRMDQLDPVEYFTKVAARTEQLIVLY